MKMIESTERAKRAAAKAATRFIQNGMSIGLGTGSTASYFIEYLIEKCRTSMLKISAVATSKQSAEQAQAGGISLVNPDHITTLDLTIDGADEIDTQKRMIKGGGGALLREKIIASISREMIVIIDQSKQVQCLGHFPLPIEVVPFAHRAILHRVHQLGYQGDWRKSQNGHFYTTDNGNYIIDIIFPDGCHYPENDDIILRSIPGVVETGLFLNIAGRVIVGNVDGDVDIIY